MTITLGKRALLAADTDRTQDYVFESARLPEIRGGSALLDRLNRVNSPHLIRNLDPSAQEIFCGGGSLLYEVDANRASQIQRELEALYPRVTGVATITCVYRTFAGTLDAGVSHLAIDQELPVPLSEFERQRVATSAGDMDCFGAWVRLLGHDLRRRKQEKEYVPFVEAPSYAVRCQSCRTRPAQGVVSYYGDERPRCHECELKNDESLRFIWRDRFDERLKTLHAGNSELVNTYFAEAPKGTVPLDMNVIASACAPRNSNKQGYVAFIYADGDGVGSFMEHLRSQAQYTLAACRLEEAAWYAVTLALAKNLPIQWLVNPVAATEEENRHKRPTQPFEIVTVGGDDVMLIVPAHAALLVARDLAQGFVESWQGQRQTFGAEWQPLTLSVGVVIAPQHMPVRLMRDFARELLKKGAKARAREARTAAVDFQVFISTALYGTDVMTMRGWAPYTLESSDQSEARPLRLFRRPYTIAELDNLLNALTALDKADFSTSQLHGLAAALEQGRRRSTLFYLYQRGRLNQDHRQALAQVEAIIAAKPQCDPIPWYRASDPSSTFSFNTTLRDIAELYDFVPQVQDRRSLHGH